MSRTVILTDVKIKQIVLVWDQDAQTSMLRCHYVTVDSTGAPYSQGVFPVPLTQPQQNAVNNLMASVLTQIRTLEGL